MSQSDKTVADLVQQLQTLLKDYDGGSQALWRQFEATLSSLRTEYRAHPEVFPHERIA